MQACGIGMGLQLLQTSAPHQRPALAEAAGLDVQPRGLETSTSNLSLLTVRGAALSQLCSVRLLADLCANGDAGREFPTLMCTGCPVP